MILSFSEHGDEPIKFERVYEPGEIDLDDEDARVCGAIEVAGEARLNSKIAFVAGAIRAKVEMLCSRCAQTVETNLDTRFAVEFVTADNYPSGNQEVALTNRDLALSVYDGDRIDVDEIVREQVLLDLPARALCSDACQGLCLTCGKNKNNEACSCDRAEVDPRWTALKELKINNGELKES